MNKPRYATADEIKVIKEFVLIPIVLSVFDRDMKIILSSIRSPDAYADAIKRAMDLATQEISAIKQFFRVRGIKIIQQEKRETGVFASYLCRGYQNDISLLWSFIEAEVDIRKRRYLGEMIESIVLENDIDHFILSKSPPVNVEDL
ncbi:hypothetical protein [Paenibacillus chitinolyticus]|uniref:hypothetical protein n=1 Tax=Paenibacillus chitinolyticus TaxID=79263 RepID=UPI00210BB447|nr:hypothetical protein [Paenibacillus chitinolyticus]